MYVSILLGMFLGVELLRCMVNLFEKWFYKMKQNLNLRSLFDSLLPILWVHFPEGFIYFTFMSMIQFELIILRKVVRLSLTFCLWCSIASAPSLKKTTFPPLKCFAAFVQNQLGIFMCVYFSIPYAASLIHVSITLSTLYSLDYCNYITPWNYIIS